MLGGRLCGACGRCCGRNGGGRKVAWDGGNGGNPVRTAPGWANGGRTSKDIGGAPKP